jgi:hypothetical protein
LIEETRQAWTDRVLGHFLATMLAILAGAALIALYAPR